MDDDAQIRKVGLPGKQEAMSRAGLMNFDADKVKLWICRSLFNQRLTVAKTYLEYALCMAPKQVVQIQVSMREFDAVLRPQLLECTLLCFGHPTCSFDEASDGPYFLHAIGR